MQTARKYSRKREAILACVRDTDVHPSAEWVYARLKPQIPDLSLGTVYRNLALFRREGTIRSVGVFGGLERVDGVTAPHAHFVCQRCGRIEDLDTAPPPAALLEEAQRKTGGKISGCQLTFTGLCRSCQASDPSLPNKTSNGGI